MAPRRGAYAALHHRVLDLLATKSRAFHASEIQKRLDLGPRAPLADVLDDLVADGLAVQRSGRRYRLAPGAKIDRGAEVEGTLVTNPRGFGFVKLLGKEDDIYVPGGALGGAMHGDRVRARVVATTSRGREGEVVDIVERGQTRVVGLVEGRPRQRYLVPDDSRVRGPVEIVNDGGLEPDPEHRGQAGVVELTRYPIDARENPQGRLLAVLGRPGDPDVEVAKVLIGHGIEEEHGDEAVAEATAYGTAPAPDVLEEREDLTHLPFLTIDPADARDHDDAVWVERDDRGHYDVWIAIADVAHYVRPGTALDEEAQKRCFSVYLPDRAVPMLPHALSGHLCSLVAGEERLCMVVHVQLDPTGAVTSSRILEAKMRGDAYVTYPSVARALGFTVEPPRDPVAEERRGALQVAWDLASQLRKRRMRRGAIDFDLPEARIVVDDETRAPIAISQRSHDPGVRKAYRLVEEMMLLANETVARYLLERKLPGVFRVHGAPDPDKIERFAAAAETLGFAFDVEDAADPKKLTKFLRKIEGHERAGVLHGLLLRAMKQAAYDTVNVGHFGLAASAYLHFTSPIRRYPDLMVHRILKRHLREEEVDDRYEEKLQENAITCSQRERNVMEVEREVADVYRCLLMKSQIGEIFEGRVTAITPGGLYVRLDEPFVDVLVTLDGLGRDAYEPDEAGLKVVGRRSGDRILLGERMTVHIEDVALLRRTVYGRRIAPEPTEARSSRGGRDKKRKVGRSRSTSRSSEKKAKKAPERSSRKGKPKGPKKSKKKSQRGGKKRR